METGRTHDPLAVQEMKGDAHGQRIGKLRQQADQMPRARRRSLDPDRNEPTVYRPHTRTCVHTRVQSMHTDVHTYAHRCAHTGRLGKGNAGRISDDIKKSLLIFRCIIWLFLKVFFILEIHTKVYMDKMKNKTEKKYVVASNTVLS